MADGKKIFRDPIYNLIVFDKEKDRLILDLIDTPEMQRLKRIRQLGVSWFTYPSAVHDRFAHSIGVAYLVGKMFDAVTSKIEKTDIDIEIEEGDSVKMSFANFKLLIQTAGLLHDIGHGPFSHAFEQIIRLKKTGYSHEDVSCRIIESAESFKQFFIGEYERFPELIILLLKNQFPSTLWWAQSLISSQFDADRIDYLLRDAYMCGVKYVRFDWQWVLENIMIHQVPSMRGQQTVILDAKKGLCSIEAFIVSRYHMYEQVYFHKTTRCIECMLVALFKLVSQKLDQGKLLDHTIAKKLKGLLDNPVDMDLFNYFDDFKILSLIHHWALFSEDDFVRELSRRIINRNHYKLVCETSTVNNGNVDEYDLKRAIEDDHGREMISCYFLVDNLENAPYRNEMNLGKDEGGKSIWVLDVDGKVKDFTTISDVITPKKRTAFQKQRHYIHPKYIELA